MAEKWPHGEQRLMVQLRKFARIFRGMFRAGLPEEF